jgi:small subunit ribosomal protein S15
MESSGQNSAAESKRTTGSFTADDVAVGSLRLSSKNQSEVVKQFQRNSQDCGSPEVQIALLTRRLEILTSHFGKFPKDHHSRKGMMDIISRRKRMLHYLKSEDVNRYRSTIAALGLRK